MTVPPKLPTILLIHGLWHRPAHYKRLINVLEEQGFKVVTPALPSTGGDVQHGLHADASVIENVIRDLVREEEEVLVIAHSYGGLVVTEALKVHETRKARAMLGKKGGVLGIAFVAAFVLTPGQTLLGALGGRFPPFNPIDLEGKFVMLHSKERFAYDLPPKETEEWLQLLAPVSVNTHTDVLNNCGFLNIPNLYLYATDDKAIVHPIQKKMIHAAKIFGGSFVEETIEDGHSPFATKPEEVVQLIRKHLDAGLWNVEGFSAEETKVQQELLGEGLQKMGGIMMEMGEIPGGQQ